jgi:hypothetical protein
MSGSVSNPELLAYQELCAELVNDMITLSGSMLSDFQTILDANDNKAFARNVGYFEEIVSSMEVILLPIVRAVT